MERPTSLPIGVTVMPLTTHSDSRGDLTEIIRKEWHESPAPVQWIVTRTGSNIMRGVHVHLRNWDYACVVAGEMIVGLHDLRPRQPAVSALLHLTGARLQMLVIPPGVAHGFYFASATTYFYALSHYWTPTGDLGCRWDDPALGLSWPTSDPLLSQRDASASSYEDLAKAIAMAKASVRS